MLQWAETAEKTGEGARKARHSRIDAIARFVSIGGAAVLLFVAGGVTTVLEVVPGPQITQAVKGGTALYAQLTQYDDIFKTDLWAPARRAETGVTVNVPGKVQDGVTLYTSGDKAAAYLIDQDGKVLRSWQRPFSTVWQPNAGWVEQPQPDSHVYFRHAYAYPNGDLLALYEGAGDTPYGYGVVKLDRDSNVLWSYPGRAHHQFNVAPDGKIYVLTHAFVNDELEGMGHLERPRLDDFLVILSPEGEELKKIRLTDTVYNSRYHDLLYTMSGFSYGDPLHTNSVTYIDRKAAANFAFGKEGQVLLSFRELNAIGVLDLETEKLVWATRGPWLGQHDPDIMPNGNILLFDNFANFDAPEGLSRVIEFDPRTMRIVWEYRGTAERPLESRIRADQQRLANGNTLITESSGGRIVEVARDGSIVWEFVNPVRGGEGNKMSPIIAWSQRLDRTSFDPGVLSPSQQTSWMEKEDAQ